MTVLRCVVDHLPEGVGVQVVDDVTMLGDPRVGLIAIPAKNRGWCELTPDEARAVARELLVAATKTEKVKR